MPNSSADLHPETGGRFVFERRAEAPARYDVAVYLPRQRSIRCTLEWDEDGAVRVDPEPSPVQDATDAWAMAEILKLARILHRDPKARLTRWRGA
jgi:hypothetical protein